MPIEIIGDWTEEDEKKRVNKEEKEIDEFIKKNPYNPEVTDITNIDMDYINSLDPIARQIAIDNYHNWLKKVRAEDKRQRKLERLSIYNWKKKQEKVKKHDE